MINKVRIKESKVLEIMAQLLMAAADMANKNVIHRDIKDMNIFISEDGSIRLGDFGAAHIKESTDIGTSTVIGSAETMAPEIKLSRGLEYDTEWDIYSIGVVVFQLLYLANYHDCLDDKMMPIKFFKRTGMSEELYEILKSMLKKRGRDRIKLHKIFEYEIIVKAVQDVINKYYINEDGGSSKGNRTYMFEKEISEIALLC